MKGISDLFSTILRFCLFIFWSMLLFNFVKLEWLARYTTFMDVLISYLKYVAVVFVILIIDRFNKEKDYTGELRIKNLADHIFFSFIGGVILSYYVIGLLSFKEFYNLTIFIIYWLIGITIVYFIYYFDFKKRYVKNLSQKYK